MPVNQPEQTFFTDPALDRVMGVLFNLTAEVQVLRDRMQSIEAMLDARGSLTRADLDTFEPDATEAARRAADRRAFVHHVFEPLAGRAASKSEVKERP